MLNHVSKGDQRDSDCYPVDVCYVPLKISIYQASVTACIQKEQCFIGAWCQGTIFRQQNKGIIWWLPFSRTI